MIASIISFVLMLIVRILFGYLATVYDYLKSWLPWFTGLTVALGVVAVVFIVIKIIKAIKSGNAKKGG